MSKTITLKIVMPKTITQMIVMPNSITPKIVMRKKKSFKRCLPLRLYWSYELCFNVLMGLQYKGPKLKDQRPTLTFRTNF